MNAPSSSALEAHEQLSAYLDGELDSAARARVEALLESDPAAGARLADHRALSALLRASLEQAADEVDFTGFVDAVMKRLPERKPRLRERMRMLVAPLFEQRRFQVALGAGVMAAVALVAAPFLLGGDAGTSIPPGLLLAGGPSAAHVISVKAASEHETMLFKTSTGTTIIYVQGAR